MAERRKNLVDEAPVTGKVVSQEDRDRKALLQALTALGAGAVGDDSILFSGTKIVLPESLKGPNGLQRAKEILTEHQKQQEMKFNFSRTFPYRPYDGAAAFERAMMRLFGTAGIGKARRTFFGEYPPELVTIDVGWNKTMQVPMDQVNFALLEATFDIGGTMTENGACSYISVEAPRKYRAMIEGFFRVVEEELRENSIYQGKAINGAEEHPGFWNEHEVDASRIVYNDATKDDLYANVWSAIIFADAMRAHSVPLKRAFLLAGPWGTGKTMAGALTAQHATAHGWTFIRVRPEDDPLQAIQTAKLYAPAVVWIEDADNLASKRKSRASITRVLDVMDGIEAKGKDIIVGFTTNYAEQIEKGMLRPGRIDAVIKVGAVEPSKVRPLLEAVIDRPLLSPKIDWDAVTEAFADYVPAFAVEAAQRAVRYSIARNEGRPSVLETEDLVKAAAGLRDQERMMNSADEAGDVATVESTITEVVIDAAEDALKRTRLGGHEFTLTPRENRNGVAVRN